MDEDIRQLRQLANITTPDHDPTNPISKPPLANISTPDHDQSNPLSRSPLSKNPEPSDVKTNENNRFQLSELANIFTPGDTLSQSLPDSTCMPSKPSILFPLYIYPSPGAWDPLYTAISNNPSLQFIIIINPHNGPGDSELPDENYSTEIPKLNSYANVTTLGYVALNYSHKKSLDAVFEIEKYAGWGKSGVDGLYIEGVFFDEVPNIWDRLGAGRKRRLDSVNSYVRKCEGIGGERIVSHLSLLGQIFEHLSNGLLILTIKQVIHNPGTVPDPEYTNPPGPDLTVVAEQSFATYKSEESEERLMSLLRYEREKCAFIIHSVPKEEIGSLVKQLKGRGGAIFVTELSEDVYCGFGNSWGDFVEAMGVENEDDKGLVIGEAEGNLL